MRVAIVNDSPMAVEALRRSLAFQSGLKIAWTAIDGADAVAKAKADTPDLVLMDLIMPGIDGVEATRRIKAAQPEATVVAWTTLDDPAAARSFFDAGAEEFIVKHDIATLERVLRRYCAA